MGDRPPGLQRGGGEAQPQLDPAARDLHAARGGPQGQPAPADPHGAGGAQPRHARGRHREHHPAAAQRLACGGRRADREALVGRVARARQPQVAAVGGGRRPLDGLAADRGVGVVGGHAVGAGAAVHLIGGAVAGAQLVVAVAIAGLGVREGRGGEHQPQRQRAGQASAEVGPRRG